MKCLEAYSIISDILNKYKAGALTEDETIQILTPVIKAANANGFKLLLPTIPQLYEFSGKVIKEDEIVYDSPSMTEEEQYDASLESSQF
jgi:hypothetical protein